MGSFGSNSLFFALAAPLLLGLPFLGGAQSIPAKLDLELFYANPWDNAKDGWCDIMPHDRRCDVFFKICIWNGNKFSPPNCDVAEVTTRTFDESKSIEIRGEDHIQILLRNGPPPIIRLRVEAWDRDHISSHDQIATFVSEAVYLNSEEPLRPVNLVKVDQTPSNQAVLVSLSLKLECSMHYYGRLCETYCKSDFKSYLCDSQGKYVCYPGFKGSMCSEKDYCYFEPCPPQAVCANNPEGNGRTCYCNGGSGPECYEVRDVCNPSPCQNDGVCQKTGPHGQQFVCQCKGHWYGPICNERYSSCQAALNVLKLKASTQEGASSDSTNISVCANGGTCVDHPRDFSHTCECTSGWKGENCEIPDWTETVLLSIFIPVLLVCCVILIITCTRRRKANRCICIPAFSTPKIAVLRTNMGQIMQGIHKKQQSNPPNMPKFEKRNDSDEHDQPAKLYLCPPTIPEHNDTIPGETNDTYATIDDDTSARPSLNTTSANGISTTDIYVQPLIANNSLYVSSSP
ncbi:calcium ion binding [Sparganum proliferum]